MAASTMTHPYLSRHTTTRCVSADVSAVFTGDRTLSSATYLNPSVTRRWPVCDHRRQALRERSLMIFSARLGALVLGLTCAGLGSYGSWEFSRLHGDVDSLVRRPQQAGARGDTKGQKAEGEAQSDPPIKGGHCPSESRGIVPTRVERQRRQLPTCCIRRNLGGSPGVYGFGPC